MLKFIIILLTEYSYSVQMLFNMLWMRNTILVCFICYIYGSRNSDSDAQKRYFFTFSGI